ncbi:MAG: HAD-IB family hydrolase [Clostridiales bacterium]|nr:HAD-IB family hydrolase [Clostridiales bacterium]
MTGRTAAFFDIDGTISREGLISEMLQKLIRYEIIDLSQWTSRVEPAFTKWDKRVGDYDIYLMKMVETYSDTVLNTDPFHIKYIAKRVIEQKGERVYAYTRDRILWHKRQGHKVVAISGSPIELVSEMARKYGLDDYKGTIYKIGDDGKYNGEIIPMWDRVSKNNAVLEMAEKYDLDLSLCYAYGDTAGDLTMMRLVGNPIAVNPTRELVCSILSDNELKKKTNIVVERKDVIYHLKTKWLEEIEGLC